MLWNSAVPFCDRHQQDVCESHEPCGVVSERPDVIGRVDPLDTFISSTCIHTLSAFKLLQASSSRKFGKTHMVPRLQLLLFVLGAVQLDSGLLEQTLIWLKVLGVTLKFTNVSRKLPGFDPSAENNRNFRF